jgi:hypothetical protein
MRFSTGMDKKIHHNKILEIKNFESLNFLNAAMSYIDLNNTSCGIHNQEYHRQHGDGYFEWDRDCLENINNPNAINKVFSFLDIALSVKKVQKEIEEYSKEASVNVRVAAHKYRPGASSPVHSDQYPFAAILYLNDNYDGGCLYFPEQDISIKPSAGSLYIFPGKGMPHGVSEIIGENRYAIVSFWDLVKYYDGSVLEQHHDTTSPEHYRKEI